MLLLVNHLSDKKVGNIKFIFPILRRRLEHCNMIQLTRSLLEGSIRKSTVPLTASIFNLPTYKTKNNGVTNTYIFQHMNLLIYANHKV